jgi:hypothetical protein
MIMCWRGGRPLDGRDAAAVLRGAGDDAPARFWQLSQFQPVGWYQRGDARGTVEAGASPFEPPKSDADKRVMER